MFTNCIRGDVAKGQAIDSTIVWNEQKMMSPSFGSADQRKIFPAVFWGR
jgi:hypothetical protein